MSLRTHAYPIPIQLRLGWRPSLLPFSFLQYKVSSQCLFAAYRCANTYLSVGVSCLHPIPSPAPTKHQLPLPPKQVQRGPVRRPLRDAPKTYPTSQQHRLPPYGLYGRRRAGSDVAFVAFSRSGDRSCCHTRDPVRRGSPASPPPQISPRNAPTTTPTSEHRHESKSASTGGTRRP